MLYLIKIRKQLKNELNLNRNFTRTEKRYIKIWVKKYKYILILFYLLSTIHLIKTTLILPIYIVYCQIGIKEIY